MPACAMAAAVKVKQVRASSIHYGGETCVWAKASWLGYRGFVAVLQSEIGTISFTLQKPQESSKPKSFSAKPLLHVLLLPGSQTGETG